MKRLTLTSIFIIGILLLAGCAAKTVWLPLWTTPPPGSTSGLKALPSASTSASATTKASDQLFANEADSMEDPKITVYKSKHILEVWDGDTLMARMKVAIGKGATGPKQKTGDNKTPEGSYYICKTSDKGKFYKFLFISYPNEDDASAGLEAETITQSQSDSIKTAAKDKKQPPWDTGLGGEIAITGIGTGGEGKTGDWTAGSIAVSDKNMDYLWKYAVVGVDVVIKP
jgi:hypothetical protein